ncbi:MAG: GTPase Era [Vulcanimicrobiota bacterium]
MKKKTETDTTEIFKSGFVAIIGKTNVGKSTMINALIGNKVAIVSPKPQTTRHRILGVKNGKDYQIVFVDTPGIHMPTHDLGRIMEKISRSEIQEADIIVFVADAYLRPDEEDRKACAILRSRKSEESLLFLVLNKIDRVKPERMPDIEKQYTALANFKSIFHTCALTGKGLTGLEKALVKHLPEGPRYFPEDMQSDQNEELIFAEAVREKILEKLHQEIPHGIFVLTEEIREGTKEGDLYARAVIYVERESHKRIVIGKGGVQLKEIGIAARKELESRLGKEIYLDLWVKVKEKWKDRKDLMKSWGYE